MIINSIDDLDFPTWCDSAWSRAIRGDMPADEAARHLQSEFDYLPTWRGKVPTVVDVQNVLKAGHTAAGKPLAPYGGVHGETDIPVWFIEEHQVPGYGFSEVVE